MGRLAMFLPVVLAAAVVLGGCGGSSSDAEIRQTFSAYEQTLRVGDGVRACALATNALRMQMAGEFGASQGEGACEGSVRRDLALNERVHATTASYAITKVAINGASATATLRTLLTPWRGRAERVPGSMSASFIESGGRWLVGSIPESVASAGQLFKANSPFGRTIAKQFQRSRERSAWTPIP